MISELVSSVVDFDIFALVESWLSELSTQTQITYPVDPIWVSNTNESRSTEDPEPVLVNVTVCDPIGSPDFPPNNCWKAGVSDFADPWTDWPSTAKLY